MYWENNIFVWEANEHISWPVMVTQVWKVCPTLKIWVQDLTMQCQWSIMFNAYAKLATITIHRIKDCLTKEAIQILVHSVISSRLDSCKALLADIPDYLAHCFQVLQNCAARQVSEVHKKEHIAPVLSSLHWLPVECRIKFKVLLLLFKALNGKAPCRDDATQRHSKNKVIKG